jgi:hypothetical protein
MTITSTTEQEDGYALFSDQRVRRKIVHEDSLIQAFREDHHTPVIDSFHTGS